MGDMHAALVELQCRRQQGWTVPFLFDVSEDGTGDRVIDLSNYIGEEARNMALDPPIVQFPREIYGVNDKPTLIKNLKIAARTSGFDITQVKSEKTKTGGALKLACRRYTLTRAQSFQKPYDSSGTDGSDNEGHHDNNNDSDDDNHNDSDADDAEKRGDDPSNDNDANTVSKMPLYKPGIVTQDHHRRKRVKRNKKNNGRNRSQHNRQYLTLPVTKKDRCNFHFTVHWSDKRNEWFMKPGFGCRHHCRHDPIDIALLPFRRQLLLDNVVEVAKTLGSAKVSGAAVQSYLFESTGQMPTYSQADRLKLPTSTKLTTGQTAQAHVTSKVLRSLETQIAVFVPKNLKCQIICKTMSLPILIPL